MVALMAAQKPLIAVDTNVLLDYANEDETVLDCFSTIRKKFPGCSVFVLPTVIDELVNHQRAGSGQESALALKALRNILNWGFKPINVIPVGNGIVEETARKIRVARLLPEEEINDSYIIAEAALANVEILLSSDEHLKGIDQAKLKRILDDCDLTGTVIFSPWKIVKQFYNSVH
jgi:predicted nucleic acid-binding protein